MVISSRPLVELVPVQPAAMEGRQICQWDKDSCADAGFLKIDLLGLGMLSAVEDCVDQIARLRGEPIDLSRIPLDDQAVYAEIQRADTVGDFQIESRAQMQSLLRTRPENLDDLTIQVALVRPGPIQGGAVHPYIERRQKLREDPAFVPPVDHPSLAEPLRETLGVVVFQDQVLEVAMALAGFTVGEAEALRRAMSRKRSEEAIEALRPRFVEGALGQGVDEELANRVYDKLVGFSGFGFPKSHSAAFALLAYQSAWLRHHYPAEFLCALLNAQPMGFYPPASLVRDGQRRGVEVRPPDVNLSGAKCAIEDGAVRVGLGYVRSVGEEEAEAVAAEQPYADVADLARRAPVNRAALGGARRLGRLRPVRRRGASCSGGSASCRGPQSAGGGNRQLALPLEPTAPVPELPAQTDWERMLADYGTTGLSVGPHPLELLRPHLPAATLSSRELARPSAAGDGRRRRHGDRAPAPGDRERGRLHAARGRVRPGEPDRPAAGLRALPRRSSAASRCSSPAASSSASDRNLNVLVSDARDARPARPRDRRRGRGARRAAAGAPLRSPLSRAMLRPLLEHVGAGDERQVRERLREVAEHPARDRVVLLGDQAEVVAQAEEPREERARLVGAADQREVRGVPERARQEDALARRQPVDLDVLLVGLVARDQPVPARACGRSPRPCRSPAGRPAAGSRRAGSAGRSRPVASTRTTGRTRRARRRSRSGTTSAWISSRTARQRSTGPGRSHVSHVRTARSNATQAITFECVKCRFGPRTSQIPASGCRQADLQEPEQVRDELPGVVGGLEAVQRGRCRRRRSPRRRHRAASARRRRSRPAPAASPRSPGSQSSSNSGRRRSPATPYMIWRSAGSPAAARNSQLRHARASSR